MTERELRAACSISSPTPSADDADAILIFSAESADVDPLFSLLAPSDSMKQVEAVRWNDVVRPLRKRLRDTNDAVGLQLRGRFKCLTRVRPDATPREVVVEAMIAIKNAE